MIAMLMNLAILLPRRPLVRPRVGGPSNSRSEIPRQFLVAAFSLVAVCGPWILPAVAEHRQIMSLDGAWQVAEGKMDRVPASFDHTAPVPGLVDLAKPAFAEVGIKSPRREAFWYRRTFHVEGELPLVALLKLNKAMFGTQVFLNGRLVGEHMPSFTPGWFNVREYLKGGSQENELIVRVGAWRDAMGKIYPDGFDFEKIRYSPGIYDSVELILTGTPHVVRVQAVPEVESQAVRVVALLRNEGAAVQGPVRFTVREARSRRVVGEVELPAVSLAAQAEHLVDARVPVDGCRLWSPEDPFLYELIVSTPADTLQTRFGMRSFRFDRESGFALLNGRRYPLRGSNVCIFRFFEDSECGDKPWDEAWVRRLHQRFKEMHWNSLRYCIGFPPESWYRIADEEGLLLQDEFPLWYVHQWPPALKSDQLILEFTEWMQERWNHPSVVLWDAQNETVSEETSKTIAAVRTLDLSNRPWDNGWSNARAATDVYEAHPYAGIGGTLDMAEFGRRPAKPGRPGALTNNEAPYTGNPVLINEYGWLWLNRNGTPTKLSRPVYDGLLGANASADQLRYTHARLLAAKTEFWRSHQEVAGVLHFCGLGYSRPALPVPASGQTSKPTNSLRDAFGNVEGATSDDFVDLDQLQFEPNFKRFVGDAFAPIGLMIDWWGPQEFIPAMPAQPEPVPVAVINDLDEEARGELRLLLVCGGALPPSTKSGQIIAQVSLCVKPKGRELVRLPWMVPPLAGQYHLVAEYSTRGQPPVQSWRDFVVKSANSQ